MKEDFLNLAIEYAKLAYKENEVPVGAVIVKNNEIIGYGYNQKEKKQSVLEHAELIAIRMAEQQIKNWRLNDCDLYVSLDPCPMCASAIKQARIKNVYSAINNSDKNNLKIIEEIFKQNDINAKVNFISNLKTSKMQEILKSFFKKQRNS